MSVEYCHVGRGVHLVAPNEGRCLGGADSSPKLDCLGVTGDGACLPCPPSPLTQAEVPEGHPAFVGEQNLGGVGAIVVEWEKASWELY